MLLFLTLLFPILRYNIEVTTRIARKTLMEKKIRNIPQLIENTIRNSDKVRIYSFEKLITAKVTSLDIKEVERGNTLVVFLQDYAIIFQLVKNRLYLSELQDIGKGVYLRSKKIVYIVDQIEGEFEKKLGGVMIDMKVYRDGDCQEVKGYERVR